MVLINGKYRYNLNGKEITFQWFEGQQWTKEELDAVISDILNNRESSSSYQQSSVETSHIIAPILVLTVIFTLLIIKRFRK